MYSLIIRKEQLCVTQYVYGGILSQSVKKFYFLNDFYYHVEVSSSLYPYEIKQSLLPIITTFVG